MVEVVAPPGWQPKPVVPVPQAEGVLPAAVSQAAAAPGGAPPPTTPAVAGGPAPARRRTSNGEIKCVHVRENGERFLVGAQVRLETLFFPIAPGERPGEDAAQVRIAAQQAAEAVRAGRTLAEAYASARGTFPGVQLHAADFVPSEDLLPELQREVRRLRTGESSPPFFTEAGAYLLRVVERRGGAPGEFSSVKDALTEELTDRRSEKAYADLLIELKRSASIDIRL